MAKVLSKLFLLLVPAYCVLFLNTVNINNSPIHASSCDPSYAYLFNSLNLASGYMKTGHWDHPGTTAQMLGAVNLKINHLIYGESDIIHDVISSPEFYLRKMSFLQVLVLGIIVFILGLLLLIKTGNLAAAFVLQVSPIVSHFGFYLADKPIPEYYIVLGLLFFNYYSMLYVLSKDNRENRAVIALAIVTAFLVATKFYILPIVVVPVLLFRKWKLLLKYFLVTLFSFSILIFPIWTKLQGFVEFILNIATHSGQYGKGEEGIVNTETYADNLLMCFTQNIAFSVLTIILLTTSIFILIRDKKLPHIYAVAVLITVFAQVLIVAKHYSPHYLLSAEALLFPAFFILLSPFVFSEDKGMLQLRKLSNVGFVIAGILIVASSFYMFKFFEECENPTMETTRFLNNHEIEARIYPHSVFCPAPEPALYYGGRYSRDREMKYKYIFGSIYPNSYFFNTSTMRLESWFVDLLPSEIIKKHGQLLFVENQYVRGTLDLLLEQINSTIPVRTRLLHLNEKTNEKVFLIETDTHLKNEKKLLVSCGMEVLSEDRGYFLADSSEIKFDGAMVHENEVYKSGGSSIRMDGTMHYAFHGDIPVEAGKNYKFEIWRFSPKDKGVIVVTNPKVEGFYFHCYFPVVKEKYWELMQVNVQVPKEYPEETVSMYLWNPTKDVAYFDDLRIYEVY